MKMFLLTAGLATLATPGFSQTLTNPTFPGSDLNRTVTLEAQLNPLNQNPPVMGRSATGMATVVIRLDRNSVASSGANAATVLLNVSFNSSQNESITAAHIHRGRAGSNGPVVLDFQIPQAAQTQNPGGGNVFATQANQNSTISNQITVTNSDQMKTLEEIIANPSNFYVNVHTQANPDGHVRGQLSLGAGAGIDRVDTRFNAVDTRFDAVNTDLIEVRRLLVALAFKNGIITSQQRDDMNKDLDTRSAAAKK